MSFRQALLSLSCYYLNCYKEGRKVILQRISMGKNGWPTFGTPQTVKAESQLNVKL